MLPSLGSLAPAPGCRIKWLGPRTMGCPTMSALAVSHQAAALHMGATRIVLILSLSTFSRARGSRGTGGKA